MPAQPSRAIAALMAVGEPPDILAGRIGRPVWMDDAACRGQPTRAWFGGAADENTVAVAVCRRCPVRRPCLDYAVEHGLLGVWGGTNEGERRRLRRGRRSAQA